MTQKILTPYVLVLWAFFSGFLTTRHASSRASLPVFPPSQSSTRLPESSSTPNLRFDCLSTSDGLSFSLSTSIAQDQRGFMWFGTRYGLNKFDGQNFTVYLPGISSDLMGGNYIQYLYQDPAGDLWISTSIDLVRWEQKTEKFVHYTSDPDNPVTLSPGRINTFGKDSNGAIWVGTNNGLNRYNPSTGTFTRYLQNLGVFKIYTDRQGGVWLGTHRGLWYFSSGSFEQQNPVHYQNNPTNPNSLSSDSVYALYEDRQGILWVGTQYGGLNRLDRATGQFTRYLHNSDDPYSLSDDTIWSILEDSAGRLWVGTQVGLNLLDRTTGRFFQYHFEPGDTHSLRDDKLYDIYQDRSGVVWFATEGGICKINETASRFTLYQQGPHQPDANAETQKSNFSVLSDNMVVSVYQDSHGLIWLGMVTGGLNRLDRNTGSVTVFQHDPSNPSSLGWGEVNAIYEDRDGTLWIGTDRGLQRFNFQKDTFQSVAVLGGHMIGSIVEDRRGNLWVSGWGTLLRRKSGESTFGFIPEVSEKFAMSRIQRLYADSTGVIWIATQNDGLLRLDPVNEATTPTLIHFPQDSTDPKSPGVSPVMSFYEDTDGALWMGSIDDGLLRYNRDSQTFTHYLPETGIARFVSCIQGDAQGFLWMGTALGLARFDPRRETFSYYDARDGLVIGENISCFQSKQGEMFFGGWQGLLTFFPAQIQDNPNAPPVVITAVNLRNQVLRTDLNPDEHIKLSYRDNYLSFDFAALDYTTPAKNQYAYKMEGLDAEWIDAGTRRHADYPDLKPGTYTFRLKASNNSGVWNEQGAAVHITITPPFWQTWWFFGLLGVVTAGIIVGGVRLRLKGVETRSRDLEKQVNERTSALEQKTLELQQLNEKSRELAVLEERSRLARELHDAVTQTLFSASLVAEALPKTWEKDPQEGRGLLRELRSLSRGALAEMRTLLLELRPAALAETPLTDLLRQLGEAASGREGIPVNVQVEGNAELPVEVKTAFYRITQEALNNVVKHARAQQVTVRLCMSREDQASSPQKSPGEQPVDGGLSAFLSISDDGRGFDPAQIPPNRLGVGIMHERAQAIGATLTIESQPGKGTQVTAQWKQMQKQEPK